MQRLLISFAKTFSCKIPKKFMQSYQLVTKWTSWYRNFILYWWREWETLISVTKKELSKKKGCKNLNIKVQHLKEENWK